ncbi:MAG: hypothetical protein PSY14_11865 [bacterium]|jgi:hypothetical protein|nr:hypothetical protein [Alphaproteobacteria bacterium]MDI1228372.1 hypothetical protein [bacterium]
MIDNTAVALLTLSLTLLVHLVTTVWWAASITRRIEFIEKWISSNEHTAERLVALEQRITSLAEGINRIELYMRERN